MVQLDLPATIDYEVSDVVTDIGTAVSNFEIGDLVCARVSQNHMGTVADYVTVDNTVASKGRFFRKKNTNNPNLSYQTTSVSPQLCILI